MNWRSGVYPWVLIRNVNKLLDMISPLSERMKYHPDQVPVKESSNFKGNLGNFRLIKTLLPTIIIQKISWHNPLDLIEFLKEKVKNMIFWIKKDFDLVKNKITRTAVSDNGSSHRCLPYETKTKNCLLGFPLHLVNAND